MNDLITFGITVFTGFFAIMNPIANVPVFISLVGDADDAAKERIAKKSTLTAFFIVLVFVILGKFIFELFGITVPAFKITGGILIFYIGFEMLQSKKSTVKHLQNPSIDENIAVSPLAIPILAGPGTIVTAMNYVTNSDLIHIFTVIAIFALMCLLTYIFFRISENFVKAVGANFISVTGKIMGLIIAIIGTNMVTEGIKAAFHLN
ncbi:MAG: MarC family protein [Chlorobi bacterium]|nr:MarC family protein [Chlorobiota bacterium]